MQAHHGISRSFKSFSSKMQEMLLGFGLLYSVEMKSTLAKLSFKLGKKYTTTV